MIDLITNPDEILLQDEPRRYLQNGKSFISVTGSIQDAGLGDDFSAVPQAILKRAQDRGNAVHAACQYYDEGDLDMESVDPAIRGYVEAYVRFTSECPIKPISVEKKLASSVLGVGGTPDLVCFLRGKRAVIDRKTCQHLGRGLGLQTAGYKLLWEATGGKPIAERYGLRLQPDGFYKLIPCTDPDDEVAFRDALEFAKAQANMERWILKYK